MLHEDVLPLLQEYCYDDFQALAKILDGRLVDLDRRRIDDKLFDPARREELFDALLAAFPELGTSTEAVSGSDDDTADEPAEPTA